MRITTNMMAMNMLRNINNNLTRMSDRQDQLSTGKRISSPMQDPVGIAKVIKYKSDLAEIDQYDRNTDDALSWLEYTESAMVSLGESYKRLSELAIQGANSTYSEVDRIIMKKEVEQIKAHIITTANSSFAGRYVFSNNKTNTKLMRSDGRYNFDITSYETAEGSKTLYQVGVGENIIINTNGIDLFGYKEEINYLTEVFPDPEGMPYTMTGSINFTNDYQAAGNPIKIDIGGREYTVDLKELKGSVANPLTPKDVQNALYNAKDKYDKSLRDSDFVSIDCAADGVIKVIAKTKGDNETYKITGSGINIFDTATYTNGVNMNNHIDKGKSAVPKGRMYKIDMTSDYSQQPVTVNVGAQTFTVVNSLDKNKLAGSSTYPITKEEMVEILYNAQDAGGNTLKDSNLVDIYYKKSIDGEEKLAILNRQNGIGGLNVSILYNGAEMGAFDTQAGSNAEPYVMNGVVGLSDADIARQKGIQDFVITLDGKVEMLNIDMDACNTIADLQTNLQNVIDSKFPPDKEILGTNPKQYETAIIVNATVAGVSFSTIDSIGAVGNPNLHSTKMHDFDVRAIQTRKSTVMEDLDNLINAFANNDEKVIGESIDVFKKHTNHMLDHRANIGAKVNRMQLIVNRSAENKVSFTKLLSEVQDVDMAEAIMYLRTSENVYRASLQTGAKIIQPSLMDFLR